MNLLLAPVRALRAKVDSLLASDSTRRSLRTFLHAVVALSTAVPALLAMLPAGSPLAVRVAAAAAGVAVVSKVWNVLEESGLIPSWLKR